MRWRVFGAVVFAFACSYGLLWGFGYARARLCQVIEDVAEQIEVACQPRFEVARGTRVLAAGEEKRLRIENVAGRVEVVPRGPDTVAEYVIYARGEDEADARRRAAARRCGRLATASTVTGSGWRRRRASDGPTTCPWISW